MVAYIMAQVNSKKKLKPTDIIKFGWEKETTSKTNTTPLSINDVEEIKKLALLREKELREKGII